jgi:hypothetical protein
MVRVKTNRESALAGNISRIIAGKIPSQKAPYGYIYRREAEVDQRGRTRILKAWWEIEEISEDNELIWGSPGWVVHQIFIWIGSQERTQYWVTEELNKLHKDYLHLFRPLYGERWFPKMVGEIVAKESYTGKAYYNKTHRVPDPNKPLGDLTMEIKKTLTRLKPESERVAFEVPAITTIDLWERANTALRERGRGRGKQGKKIQALFRGRMMCPLCGKPMTVMRKKKTRRIYYYCRARYSKWLEDPCPYSRSVPGTWDNGIWQEICELLKNDVWIEQQLVTELDNSQEINILIRLQEHKIKTYQGKIRKAEEGFDGGLYTLEEAKLRKQKSQEIIDSAQVEIDNLRRQIGNSFTTDGIDKLKLELKSLQSKNLKGASFEERLNLVAKLNIKVYPSEDLKSRRIKCGMNIRDIQKTGKQDGSAKVVYGRPCRSRTCDTLIRFDILTRFNTLIFQALGLNRLNTIMEVRIQHDN